MKSLVDVHSPLCHFCCYFLWRNKFCTRPMPSDGESFLSLSQRFPGSNLFIIWVSVRLISTDFSLNMCSSLGRQLKLLVSRIQFRGVDVYVKMFTSLSKDHWQRWKASTFLIKELKKHLCLLHSGLSAGTRAMLSLNSRAEMFWQRLNSLLW